MTVELKKISAGRIRPFFVIESKTVLIPFHSDRQLDYGKQVFYEGGYLFLQSVYYGLKLDRVCRKIRSRHKFEYDINAFVGKAAVTEDGEKAGIHFTLMKKK